MYECVLEAAENSDFVVIEGNLVSDLPLIFSLVEKSVFLTIDKYVSYALLSLLEASNLIYCNSTK